MTDLRGWCLCHIALESSFSSFLSGQESAAQGPPGNAEQAGDFDDEQYTLLYEMKIEVDVHKQSVRSRTWMDIEIGQQDAFRLPLKQARFDFSLLLLYILYPILASFKAAILDLRKLLNKSKQNLKHRFAAINNFVKV